MPPPKRLGVRRADLHQPVGAVDRQRPEQDLIDEGENGSVGADAEPDRQNSDEGEGRRAAQCAGGVAQIGADEGE